MRCILYRGSQVLKANTQYQTFTSRTFTPRAHVLAYSTICNCPQCYIVTNNLGDEDFTTLDSPIRVLLHL